MGDIAPIFVPAYGRIGSDRLLGPRRSAPAALLPALKKMQQQRGDSHAKLFAPLRYASNSATGMAAMRCARCEILRSAHLNPEGWEKCSPRKHLPGDPCTLGVIWRRAPTFRSAASR